MEYYPRGLGRCLMRLVRQVVSLHQTETDRERLLRVLYKPRVECFPHGQIRHQSVELEQTETKARC